MISETATRPLTFDERIAAIERAIDRHHVYLERYMESLTRNHADAQELVSQLWVFALHKFKDEHLESLPILRRKAYQIHIDHYRKRMRSKVDVMETPPEIAVQHVGKEAHNTEEEAALRARFWGEFPVADLPETHKDALWLSARYGYTVKEISEKLNVPPSTIGDWLQYARKCFADHLNAI